MRKKLATKICAIVMTAAMVASMAGCGDDSGDNSQASTPGSSEAGDPGQESGGADSQESEAPDDSQEEEETYDFGGAVVRVQGGSFNALDEENKLDDKGNVKSDYTKKRDIADQLEQKYNIKIEYAKLNTDGYDEISAVVTPITNGEAHADIFCGRESVMIGAREYLADITADVDQLEIGSTYIEPGTFGGKVLGWTYDDMGNAYVLAYSRSYLKSIGMEKTPTDMFMEGKWDYDSCRTYLSDLKAKLPDGTYPISVHPNHWSSMGPAANGVVRVDSDSNVNFLEQGYISAMEFYRSLVVDQLAGQTEIKEITETGGISLDIPYGTGDMSGKAGEPGKYVLTMVEAWQFEDVLKKTEDWGIVPFPWDPALVTCTGDYTTLSDNYLIPQSLWTNVMVPKAEYRGEGAKTIPDIVLHKIASDFYAMDNANGGKVRHEEWLAESKGETYVNRGYNPDDPGKFTNEQDIEISSWMHSRSGCDWGWGFNDNGIAKVFRCAQYIISGHQDARTAGESFVNEANENLKQMGLK